MDQRDRFAQGQFMPAGQLLPWHRELDALGLRATGNTAQERYVDTLCLLDHSEGRSRCSPSR